MTVCENLVGYELPGKRRGHIWTVVEKIAAQPNATPGNFSVGYKVRNENGDEGFMKASDLSIFSKGDDILKAITDATTAHTFERSILDHCRGNNMDRVVTALDYGESQIKTENQTDYVFYLIFEVADGDMRKHVTKQGEMSLLWSVTTLHNLFVASNQLHTALVAHNDIKPANALIFNNNIQKIADLGRATSELFPAAHDMYMCAGDRRFAPPEQLYPSNIRLTHFERAQKRIVGDLYNLGSLIHFIITARMVTPEIITLLRPEHRPRNMNGGSQDSYEAALPYWQDAFASQVERLGPACVEHFGPGVQDELQTLVQMVKQLCEPDPLLRGHPNNFGKGQNQMSLERFISALDSIKKRLAIKAA